MDDTARARWDNLAMHRSLYLRRAIDCSRLTIPTLIPESDQNYGGEGEQYNSMPSLYQGVGARGVSSLSAKLLLALMPPNQPFFRLTIDMGKVRQWMQSQGQGNEGEAMTRLDQLLSSMERQVLRRLDQLQARNAMFEAIKHLLVGGNALLYVGEDAIRMHSLRSFVADRDPEGNVTEIVIREQVSERYLPRRKEGGDDRKEGGDDRDEVFTLVVLDPSKDRVEWFQECHGQRLPGSAGFSRMATNPWIPLRLHRVAGESYGRGLVEQVLGDLQSLESLTQAIVEGSLISARAIGLVNPNGVTRADALAQAENGAIVSGNAADVEFLQVQKANDFSVALQAMQLIERRLQFTFLTNESVQRDAERVTAEEIRLMAEQLEQGLGGIYSVLSAEMQLPLIRRVMHLMERNGDLPEIPEGLIEPQVTTGLEAIGRGNDKQRLTSFLSTVAASIGPEQFMQLVNPSELIRRFAAADGIDTAGLVKSEQELQAEQAQMQQANVAGQLAQGMIQNGAAAAPQSSGGATGQPDQGAIAAAGAASGGVTPAQ